MVEREDWRLGQPGRRLGEAARGATFVWKRWYATPTESYDPKTGERSPATWDHDHCEFCWQEFSDYEAPDVLLEGYTTKGPVGTPESEQREDYHWVCKICFEDFHAMFGWRVKE